MYIYIYIGTWIECVKCKKWRYLKHEHDPSILNKNWICEMNENTKYNKCNLKEQHYISEDLIDIKFNEGSIVCAQLDGYPPLVNAHCIRLK